MFSIDSPDIDEQQIIKTDNKLLLSKMKHFIRQPFWGGTSLVNPNRRNAVALLLARV